MATSPLDRAGPWRFDELPHRDDLPDGYRFEVVDGHLVVSPAPGHRHQVTARLLLDQLAAASPAEWMVVWDFGLQLGADGRVPDLAVVRTAVPHRPGPYPYGPDAFGLVIEVMSPSSRKTDLFAKPGEYAEAGIPLFWRLDLEPAPRMHAFVLRERAYVEVADLVNRGTVPVPWGEIEVDVEALRG